MNQTRSRPVLRLSDSSTIFGGMWVRGIVYHVVAFAEDAYVGLVYVGGDGVV